MAKRKSAVSPLHLIWFLLFFFMLIDPGQARAVQQHGGAEGLVAHQIGHILFIGGMLLFLYRLRIMVREGEGWLCFRLFLWLIILWNILTFYGHLHREMIDPAKYITVGGKVTGFVVQGPMDLLFYLSRLDHLLLVSSFVFLLLALLQWRKHS